MMKLCVGCTCSTVCVQVCYFISFDYLLPADTSTTAMKRAISSGSSPREPNFSLKSNMASSKDPMPSARRDAREYVCPFRKVTVLSLGSNSEQNLTIRTWEHSRNTGKYWTGNTQVRKHSFHPVSLCCSVIDCTWKVPDLSNMTWSCWLRLWKPGILLANSTTSLTAGVKHWEKDSHTCWLDRLAETTGHAFRGHAWEGDIEGGKRDSFKMCSVLCISFKKEHSKGQISCCVLDICKKYTNSPALWHLRSISRDRKSGSQIHCDDWLGWSE